MAGLKENIDVTNIYETLRYVDMKKHPQHVIPLLPAMVRTFPKLNGQLGVWLFTGERWGNIGLIKASEVLGKDGWPVVAAMKTMMPELMTRPEKEKRSAKEFQAAIDAVKKAIEAYEAKYGQVKAGQSTKA
jgi:hypothetical protein